MVIAFCYNVKSGKPSLDPSHQVDTEFDSMEVISSIKSVLEGLGHQVIMIEADLDAFEKLRKNKNKIDIVFNIAEGLRGDARESQIPLFCEMLDIAYTHSSPTVHALKLNKDLTKKVLKADGVLVPESIVVDKITKDYPIDGLKFPLIIKPNKEGSSKGVYDKNVVDNKNDLKKRLDYLIKNFGEEIVEEYIDGREFTVAVLGTGKDATVLPIIEQKFGLLPKGSHKIAGYELKWIYEYNMKSVSDVYGCPAELTKELKEKIEETTLKIYGLLNVRDCARIDYRLDDKNNLYFIEINTLPGINPDPNETSALPLAARTAGLTFEELVKRILASAQKRYASNNKN